MTVKRRQKSVDVTVAPDVMEKYRALLEQGGSVCPGALVLIDVRRNPKGEPQRITGRYDSGWVYTMRRGKRGWTGTGRLKLLSVRVSG